MMPPPFLNRQSLRCITVLLISLSAVVPRGAVSAQAGQGWTIVQELKFGDFTPDSDTGLGFAIDATTSSLFVSAPKANDGKGLVGVFGFPPGTKQPYKEQTTLADKNGKPNDQLGADLTYSPESQVLLITHPGSNNNTGGVTAFFQTGNSWTPSPITTPADVQSGDRFGSTISQVGLPNGNKPPVAMAMVVGASGSKQNQSLLRGNILPAASLTKQSASKIELPYIMTTADRELMKQTVHDILVAKLFRDPQDNVVLGVLSQGKDASGTAGSRLLLATGPAGQFPLTVTASLSQGQMSWFRPSSDNDKLIIATGEQRATGATAAVYEIVNTEPAAVENQGVWPLEKVSYLKLEPQPGSAEIPTSNLPPYSVAGLPENANFSLIDSVTSPDGGALFGLAGDLCGPTLAVLGDNPAVSGGGKLYFFSLTDGKLKADTPLETGLLTKSETASPAGGSFVKFTPDCQTIFAAAVDPKTKLEVMDVIRQGNAK